MTREEVEKLTVLDVTETLYERLGSKSVSLPRLEMELLILKDEYLAEITEKEEAEKEEELARLEFLKKQKEANRLKEQQERLGKNRLLSHEVRWNSLKAKSAALYELGYTVPNPDAWFRDFRQSKSDHEVDDFLVKAEEINLREELRKLREAEEREMELFRQKRNEFLYKTDWTQSVSDSPLKPELRKDYRLYRKYLRELPVLFEREQILDKEVMSFEEWFSNRPVFEGSTII